MQYSKQRVAVSKRLRSIVSEQHSKQHGVERLESRLLFAGYTVSSLAPFTGSTGTYGGVTLDNSGSLWGTSFSGGANGNGFIFRVTPAGTLNTVYSFPSGTNGGIAPYAGLTLNPISGDLYGVTSNGGANNAGLVYKFTPTAGSSVSVSTVASLPSSAAGLLYYGNLTFDSSGNLFGTTNAKNTSSGPYGTVFEIPKTTSTVTVLGSFTGSNGSDPKCKLVVDSTYVYGTTNSGGGSGKGTAFRITIATKTFTSLGSFTGTGTSGNGPIGSLVLSGGNLYGATQSGGINGAGTIFRVANAASSTPTLSTLASFPSSSLPLSGLVADSSGNLYGTTNNGNAVFQYAPATSTFTNTFATIPSSVGTSPQNRGGLAIDASGNIYGTMLGGGANGFGSVFVASKTVATTTALTVSPVVAAPGQPVTFTATVTPATGTTKPTGNVQFVVDGVNSGSPVALVNGTASLPTTASLIAGTHSVVANFIGNTTFAASVSAPIIQTVKAGTSTVVTSNQAAPTVGTPITFTATVTPTTGTNPTGGVQFVIDGTLFPQTIQLSNGKAVLPAISNLTPGPHTVVANYLGNASFAPSTSPTFTQTVLTPTNTVVTSTTAGSVVTFKAAVTPTSGSGTGLSGTVQFKIDGNIVASAASISGGVATLSTSTLAVGSHTVVATYSGDSKFATSISTTFTQVIKANTSTVVVSNLTAPALGTQITFTATVTPTTGPTATGTVQFQIDGANPSGSLITLVNGKATFKTSTLTAGSHQVVAIYNGSTTLNTSTSLPITQLVGATTTTSLATSPTPAGVGQPVTFTATISSTTSGTRTGTVQFRVDGADFDNDVTVIGGIATLTTTDLPLGSHTISAVYSGDSKFAGSTSATATQVIQLNQTTVAVKSSSSAPTFGTSLTFTATVSSPTGTGPTGKVQFRIDGVNAGVPITMSNGKATYVKSGLTVGNHSVVAVYLGDGGVKFAGSTSPTFTQTVLPVPVTGYSTLAAFTAQGARNIARDPAGNLFTVTSDGAVLELLSGSTTVVTLAQTQLTVPSGPLLLDRDGNLYFTDAGANGPGNYGKLCALYRGSDTVTTLVTFDQTNGATPFGGVVMDAAGNLYGTTRDGGTNGFGTIFKIPAGTSTLQTLVNLTTANQSPIAGVTLDSDGNLYGATLRGGPGNFGTVFKLAAGGSSVTTLASFDSANGRVPYGNVVRDAAGNLYGTASAGGNGDLGTIWTLSNGASTITRLASAGANPIGPLVLDSDGNLFGTAIPFGTNSGILFVVTAGSGVLNTLVSFSSSNLPSPELVLDSSGTLYGVTSGPSGGTFFTYQTDLIATPGLTADAGDVQAYQPPDAGSPQTVTFLLTASRDDGTPATIQYRTIDGTAHAGTDYQAISGTLTIDPDVQSYATLDLTILPNAANHDLSKTFFLELVDPANGKVLGSGRCEILN